MIEHSSGLLERMVTYRYTLAELVRTRKQSIGRSAQSCPRRVLRHLLPHTIDLDIENCMFTILHQLVKLMGIVLPDDLQETLHMCAVQRDDVCSLHLKTSITQGHSVVNFTIIHLHYSGCFVVCYIALQYNDCIPLFNLSLKFTNKPIHISKQ